MNMRTSSRGNQWIVWLSEVLAALLVYVVASQILYGAVSWDVLDPSRYRLAAPLVVLLVYFAWKTRWDGIVREVEVKVEAEVEVEAKAEVKAEAEAETEAEAKAKAKADHQISSPPPQPPPQPSPQPQPQPPPPVLFIPVRSQASGSRETGAAIYARARLMPHREIPDFGTDGMYLDLLGDAAAKGHLPALTKLGEYAMRRGTWVEAYFWMWQARRNGMGNLSNVMREIRRNWIWAGTPDEAENVHPLFSREAGLIARALIGRDSRHGAVAARDYLQSHHPEFL